MNESRNINNLPFLAFTLGDVAGIGPELLVRAWSSLHSYCTPLVLGSVGMLRRQSREIGVPLAVESIQADELATVRDTPHPQRLRCLEPPSSPDVSELPLGMVHARAGQAAYDYLVAGIHLALAGKISGLVTLPLNKEGLHAAGLHYPGHTEILAEKTGTTDYAMMLYRNGLGVLHVTLHMALRQVFAHLSSARIETTCRLLDSMMNRLGVSSPRLAVAALNPHASDGGLFGNEEKEIIAPAVTAARAQGLNIVGPLPADTLFSRAKEGAFDGIVAMYHDQGHIALKLLGWREAVNITVGLPMVRVSVAHGTAYDIVGRGVADPTSLLEATRVAVRLCAAHAPPV